MKVLFDYGVGGEPEGSPPTFKQCAAADIHAAFLNPTEHGEVRTIRYDGVEYEDITVIESGPKEGKRSSVVHERRRGRHVLPQIPRGGIGDGNGNVPVEAGGSGRMNTEARTNAITGSVTVTVNEAAGQAAIERAKALLAGIQGGVDKAMKASMSRTVDRLRRESNQAIREKYDITDAGIRAEKNVRVRYSYQNGVQATVTFSGRKIPLYRFGGAYPKVPTQDIAAGKKPVMVKGAWTMQYQGVAARGHQFQDTGPTQFMDVAQMKSGHIGIFERTGGSTSEGSDAIREIMGSSVAQMVGNQQVAQGLTERAYETFETELDKAVYRILTGWR